MNFHRTVLLQETIDLLNVSRGQKYIDGTIGGGGHTEEILKRGGLVLGIDADPEALEFVRERLEAYVKDGRLTLVQGNFRDILKIAKEKGFAEVSGILLDLGVSSHQIDTEDRGFSYQKSGPLDMRMDPSYGFRAEDLINLAGKHELHNIFTKLGEERRSNTVVSGIIRSRRVKAIKTTEDLVGVIAEAYGLNKKNLTPMLRAKISKRIFQALRMAVNGELESLEKALSSVLLLLFSKGIVAVISFHSLEDRLVKDAFVGFSKEGLGTIFTPKPVLPASAEILENSRSKGAKLRVFERK